MAMMMINTLKLAVNGMLIPSNNKDNAYCYNQNRIHNQRRRAKMWTFAKTESCSATALHCGKEMEETKLSKDEQIIH